MCQYWPLKDDKMTTSWSCFHLRKTETKLTAEIIDGDKATRLEVVSTTSSCTVCNSFSFFTSIKTVLNLRYTFNVLFSISFLVSVEIDLLSKFDAFDNE